MTLHRKWKMEQRGLLRRRREQRGQMGLQGQEGFEMETKPALDSL